MHADEDYYLATSSQVRTVPDEFDKHQGVFVVSSAAVSDYIERYNPVILRRNKVTQPQLCKGYRAYTFGEAKGPGFERILILTTEKHRDLLSGTDAVFDGDKTEKAKNTFYVAITCAKYSVALIYDGDDVFDNIDVDTLLESAVSRKSTLI